jgi:two-component system chemotaxis response regulator CheB
MNEHTEEVRKVVVMGASAGGIDALTEVLSRLPADLPAAILVVQHLRGDRGTHLPEHLGRHCPLPVCLACEGLPLEKGHVYVASPGQHLLIENRRLALTLEEPQHYVRPSADVLFTSVAQGFGPDVIGVVLSGTGSDGACGCQNIKARGGATIVQDQTSSRQFGMPKATIDAGAADYVLALTDIAAKIVALTHETEVRRRRGQAAPTRNSADLKI